MQLPEEVSNWYFVVVLFLLFLGRVSRGRRHPLPVPGAPGAIWSLEHIQKREHCSQSPSLSQVHYLDIGKLGDQDTTGVDISYRLTPPRRSAGMVSVHVNTRLPPYTRTFQDGGCTIAEDKVLTPLLYVVHTHRLGEVNFIRYLSLFLSVMSIRSCPCGVWGGTSTGGGQTSGNWSGKSHRELRSHFTLWRTRRWPYSTVTGTSYIPKHEPMTNKFFLSCSDRNSIILVSYRLVQWELSSYYQSWYNPKGCKDSLNVW